MNFRRRSSVPVVPRAFPAAMAEIVHGLIEYGAPVDTGHWQGMEGVPMTKTWELSAVSVAIQIPPTVRDLQREVKPNLPWAEAQFQERVCGLPLNPGETFQDWPYYRGNVEKHKPQGQFSHTYMERFWPRLAGAKPTGIRYRVGDLDDLIDLLRRQPFTRQAYLPIFFPEDTGAHHGGRIPCTLGYQFLVRNEQLHIIYHMRSCDLLRHFVDDVYMAARLVFEVIERAGWTRTVIPGILTMHMGSLHIFEQEVEMLRRRRDRGDFN